MKALTAAGLCLALASAITAQNDLSGRVRNNFTEAGIQNPNIAVNSSHKIKGSKFSAVAFCNVYKGWAEAYAGPKYVFNKWLFASAHIGMETNESWWRAAGSVGLSYKALNWFNLYEYGASGQNGDYWFSSLTFACNKSLKAEAKSYKIGKVYKIGGGAILNVFKTPLAISLAPLYNLSSEKAEVETTVYFKL